MRYNHQPRDALKVNGPEAIDFVIDYIEPEHPFVVEQNGWSWVELKNVLSLNTFYDDGYYSKAD